jgi:hypothetical protein
MCFHKVAVRMRQPVTGRPFLEEMQMVLREPTGLVCAALVIALLALAVRIASVW